MRRPRRSTQRFRLARGVRAPPIAAACALRSNLKGEPGTSHVSAVVVQVIVREEGVGLGFRRYGALAFHEHVNGTIRENKLVVNSRNLRNILPRCFRELHAVHTARPCRWHLRGPLPQFLKLGIARSSAVVTFLARGICAATCAAQLVHVNLRSPASLCVIGNAVWKCDSGTSDLLRSLMRWSPLLLTSAMCCAVTVHGSGD